MVGSGAVDGLWATAAPMLASGPPDPIAPSRGGAHPSVATPLTWAEVESGDPRPADVHTMPARLAELGDLMADPR